MENTIEIFEKFIGYHKGSISLKEKEEIEKLIKADENAKKEFEDLRMLEENIRLYYWQKEAEQVLKNKNGVLGIIWRNVAIAASVILISTFLFFSLNKDYFSDVIVEKSSLRGTSKDISQKRSLQQESYQLFLDGKVHYHANDFKSAIDSYNTALRTPNLRTHISEAIKWHLCVAYLRNDQPLEAERVLNELDLIEKPKYQIGTINKAKIKTQILVKKLFF